MRALDEEPGGVLETRPLPIPISPRRVAKFSGRKRSSVWMVPLIIISGILVAAGGTLLYVSLQPTIIEIVPKTVEISTVVELSGQSGSLLGSRVPLRSMSETGFGEQEVRASEVVREDARQARGLVTFYSIAEHPFVFAAGLLMMTPDQIQIVTDEPVSLPAYDRSGVAPFVTVRAHAVLAGTSGNIEMASLNGAFVYFNGELIKGVVAKNEKPFGGGVDQANFLRLSDADVQPVISSLTELLTQKMHAQLAASLQPQERMAATRCHVKEVNISPEVGSQTERGKIGVALECGGIAYPYDQICQLALSMVTREMNGATPSGPGPSEYLPLYETLAFTPLPEGVLSEQGTFTISLHISGTWRLRLPQSLFSHLAHLLAGKSHQEAKQMLLATPGIGEVTIRGTWGQMPGEENKILFLVKNPGNVASVRNSS